MTTIARATLLATTGLAIAAALHLWAQYGPVIWLTGSAGWCG